MQTIVLVVETEFQTVGNTFYFILFHFISFQCVQCVQYLCSDRSFSGFGEQKDQFYFNE